MDREGVVVAAAVTAEEINYSVFVVVYFEGDELDGRTYFVGAIEPQPFHLDQNYECTHKLNFPLIQPVNKRKDFFLNISSFSN